MRSSSSRTAERSLSYRESTGDAHVHLGQDGHKGTPVATTANKPSKSHSGSRQYRHEFSTGNPQSARHHGKDLLTYIAGQIRYLY